MARLLKPLVRGGGYYPSRKWTPLVYAGCYTTANGGGEPEPPPIEKTVTGNPIHITDALAKPVQALSIALEPIQDLHGYDNPWPAGGGVNKLLPSDIDRSGTTQSVTATWASETEELTLNGTNSGSYAIVIDFRADSGHIKFPDLQVGDTWTLAANFPTNAYIGVVYKTTSDTDVQYWYISGDGTFKKDTRAVPNDFVSFQRVQIGMNPGAAFSNAKCHFAFASGSTITSWTPYSNLCPISGHTDADVTRTGKNLYSRENSDYNVPVYAQDGSSAAYPDVAVWWIKAKPNTKYTISKKQAPSLTTYLRWINCDENKGFISRPGAIYSDSHFPLTITTPSGTGWVQIAVNEYPTAQISQNDWKLQIEESDTATDYEEYRGTTYPIPLGQTVYGGTLDVVTGVLTVTMKMDDLGTFSWTRDTGYQRFYAALPDAKITSSIVPFNGISSMYKAIPFNNVSQIEDGIMALSTGGNLSVRNLGLMNKTAAEFATAMSGVQLVYELATPQTIQLTPQQVELLLGENNIWSDGEMTLVYLADGNASDVEALNILLGGRYVNNHEADEPTDREALDILLGR